jgi:hypothetical protein
VITPAEGASPPLLRGPTAPNLSSTTPIADPYKEMYFPGSNGSLATDANGSAPPAANKNFPYLARRIASQSQASVFDTGAPAVPLVPSDDPSLSGGLPGRIAAVLAGIDPLNQSQPARSLLDDGTQGISSNKPARYLSRRNSNNPPASVSDTSAPTVPFALPDSLNSSRGLADWIAALAGVDPQSPEQFALPLEDGLRDFYRDDPAWFLQVRR